MKRCKIVLGISLAVLALTFAPAITRAQQEPQQPAPENPTPDNPQPAQPNTPTTTPQPDQPYEPFPDSQPKPAARGVPGLDFSSWGEGELEADYSPLTGFQNPTLGYPVIRHSYWVPGISYSSNVQSNGGGNGSSWYDDNYVMGNMSLLESWNRGLFAVNYSGGGYFSTDSTRGSGSSQLLSLGQTFRTERWLLQVIDQFSYLPQTNFGFGGGTGLGNAGVGGYLGGTIPGLGGNYVPTQSIFGGVGAVYSNTGAIQATYALTKRGSITLGGSYGLLDYVQDGNFDSNTLVGSIGYNYTLSRKDTLGLVYRFSEYQFPGNPQAYSDHVVSIAYSRKITGRLGLRLFVGPDLTIYRVPIGNSSRSLGVSTTAYLTYGFENSSFSVGYIHGLSGGSGFLIGSELDQATAGFTHRLTRVWNVNATFGYAHNGQIGGTGLLASPVYDSYYVGGGVTRPFGRDFNFGAAYTANIGSFNQAGCSGGGCSSTSTYNSVTVTVSWHPRPFILN